MTKLAKTLVAASLLGAIASIVVLAGDDAQPAAEGATAQPAEKAAACGKCKEGCRQSGGKKCGGACLGGLLGRAGALGLSDEQKAQISKIMDEARQKALAVLTDEQRNKLAELTGKPRKCAPVGEPAPGQPDAVKGGGCKGCIK